MITKANVKKKTFKYCRVGVGVDERVFPLSTIHIEIDTPTPYPQVHVDCSQHLLGTSAPISILECTAPAHIPLVCMLFLAKFPHFI